MNTPDIHSHLPDPLPPKVRVRPWLGWLQWGLQAPHDPPLTCTLLLLREGPVGVDGPLSTVDTTGTWVFYADNSQERSHESRHTIPKTFNVAIPNVPLIPWSSGQAYGSPHKWAARGYVEHGGGRAVGRSGVAFHPILESKRDRDKVHILFLNLFY